MDAIEPLFDESNDLLNCKMAEYAKAVVDGRPSFHISMVVDVSPNCDCHSENDVPLIPDVGMFASFDPVALDLACVDACNRMPRIQNAVFEGEDPDVFTAAHTTTNWSPQITHGKKIGLGSDEYELVEI